MYEYFECKKCHAFYRLPKPVTPELDYDGELFQDITCKCGVTIEVKWASNVYMVYNQVKEKEDAEIDNEPK